MSPARSQSLAALLLLLALAPLPGQAAKSAPSHLLDFSHFSERDGEALYGAICAGCHMPGGVGAKGAGAYPALAANANLASAKYITYNVVHGRRGMPLFGGSLDDEQVAAVVNYVRTHFGNHYTDVVTPEDVHALR